MATFIQLYQTSVTGGIADGDSVLITVALYGSAEPIDSGDGADLRIVDANDDGLIDADEFNAATGGGGLGQNGGSDFALFDNDSNPNTGTLYSSDPYTSGGDLNALIDGLPGNQWTPVAPEVINVCFAKGTLIKTRHGEVAVEDLAVGDKVYTSDGRLESIRWTAGRKIEAAMLAANPKLRPVCITVGALGNGLPKRRLVVSRQHRMLVSSKIAMRMFGIKDVLIPAIKLTELPGIYVDEDVPEVEYFHLLFDKHEVIFAEDTPTESLYTGPEALKALSSEAREEILTLFPELADRDYSPEPAEFLPAGNKQKELVARHLKNAKLLLSDYSRPS
jgi:hypothetical protein